MKTSIGVIALLLISSSLAFAGGYEKPDFFSAHWAALGGAAASSVSGAEAVYFNPAGLGGSPGSGELTLNFVPTWVKFSGPLAGVPSVDSKNSFFPGYGVFGSVNVTQKWGIGIGVYLAGGSKAIYENVDYTQAPTVFGQPANPALAASSSTVESDVHILEVALGTGYEILDGLRLGVEYRVSSVHATLGSFLYNPGNLAAGGATPPTLTTLTIDGITATAWNGFRVGLQYFPKDSRWGCGALWRSAVAFTGTGNLSGNVAPAITLPGPVPAGTLLPISPTTATVSNVFPQAFDLGAHYDVIQNGLRAHLQYTYTNYSVDQTLALTGLVATAAGSASLPNFEQTWNNEHDIRFGLNLSQISNWDFRASYVWSSEVTPKDRARPTLTPPGSGNTVAVGAGTWFMDKKLETDAAVEYGWSSATVGSDITPPPDRSSGIAGDYAAHELAIYLGATYRM